MQSLFLFKLVDYKNNNFFYLNTDTNTFFFLVSVQRLNIIDRYFTANINNYISVTV